MRVEGRAERTVGGGPRKRGLTPIYGSDRRMQRVLAPVPIAVVGVLVALVALLSLAAAGTRADDFPSRIIRVVVAFPAGGPTDFVARILADRLKPLLGREEAYDKAAAALVQKRAAE